MTANTHATCKFSEWIEFNDAWRPTFVVTRHHSDEHIAQLAAIAATCVYQQQVEHEMTH